MTGPKVLVVWFSKDRAFQLHQALRTFDQFACTAPTPTSAASPSDSSASATHGVRSDVVKVTQVVLYHYSSPLHHRTYRELATRHPQIAFVDESAPSPSATPTPARHLSGFQRHLQAMISEHRDSDSVMFGVDDLLFFSPFSLSAAAQLLHSNAALLAVQLALHPGLTFHQPTASALTLPTFIVPEQEDGASPRGTPPPFLLFEHAGTGSHDFRYPFSLTASLYRGDDVRLVIDSLAKGPTPWQHPNLLEAAGNTLITTLAAVPAPVRVFMSSSGLSEALTLERPLAACPTRAVCAVLTVNRVQEVFHNPVCEGRQDVEELRKLWEEGEVELDESRYEEWAKAGRLQSVHVGEWWLRPVKEH